jgi:hypothetical protein
MCGFPNTLFDAFPIAFHYSESLIHKRIFFARGVEEFQIFFQSAQMTLRVDQRPHVIRIKIEMLVSRAHDIGRRAKQFLSETAIKKDVAEIAMRF